MNTPNFVRAITVFIGVSGAFSVLFGAWLAHGGQTLELSTQARLSTALTYQFTHTLALLALIVWFKQQHHKVLMVSATLFCLGILLFSGSLYLKSLLDISAIAKLTPFGGMSFALGWIVLIWFGIKTHD